MHWLRPSKRTAPGPGAAGKGLLRSRHNNYFTLPVLFIMISNHFPSTYGSQYNWLILAGIAVIAVLVRHYFNTRHDSNKFAWTLPAGALGMICLAFVTSPNYKAATAPIASVAPVTAPAKTEAAAPAAASESSKPAEQAQAPAQPANAQANAGGADFDKVHSVIQERCSVCHSAKPTSPMFTAAPGGVMFDTPQQIQAMAPKIQAQAVATQIMPLGNITQMTQAERDLIGSWIAEGAKTN